MVIYIPVQFYGYLQPQRAAAAANSSTFSRNIPALMFMSWKIDYVKV